MTLLHEMKSGSPDLMLNEISMNSHQSSYCMILFIVSPQTQARLSLGYETQNSG